LEDDCVIENMQLPPVLLMVLFVVSSAVIDLGIYVATTGRTPNVPWRPSQSESQARVRAQGTGVVLIGAVLLLSALAVNFGSSSPVRAYWVLAVWVALIGGLLGIRYMIDSRKPRTTAANSGETPRL
jgi:hypothetical protein